jgi:hypothetical protein
MKFAFDVGPQRLMKLPSGIPAQGTTIDQASTQRILYTRSSIVSPLRMSSKEYLPG